MMTNVRQRADLMVLDGEQHKTALRLLEKRFLLLVKVDFADEPKTEIFDHLFFLGGDGSGRILDSGPDRLLTLLDNGGRGQFGGEVDVLDGRVEGQVGNSERDLGGRSREQGVINGERHD